MLEGTHDLWTSFCVLKVPKIKARSAYDLPVRVAKYFEKPFYQIRPLVAEIHGQIYRRLLRKHS
jgi:hypothetical protein